MCGSYQQYHLPLQFKSFLTDHYNVSALKIHLSEATYAALKKASLYVMVARGKLEIKVGPTALRDSSSLDPTRPLMNSPRKGLNCRKSFCRAPDVPYPSMRARRFRSYIPSSH